jgi:hypothetical protein
MLKMILVPGHGHDAAVVVACTMGTRLRCPFRESREPDLRIPTPVTRRVMAYSASPAGRASVILILSSASPPIPVVSPFVYVHALPVATPGFLVLRHSQCLSASGFVATSATHYLRLQKYRAHLVCVRPINANMARSCRAQ